MSGNSQRVYSTESGRLCPDCGKALADCICASLQAARQAGDGNVTVSRETKGRKGKGVSVIAGLPVPVADLKRIAKQLKQVCGSGGAVKDGKIEIQGDHREKLVGELTKMGYRVRG